jgi:hypothetical protein
MDLQAFPSITAGHAGRLFAQMLFFDARPLRAARFSMSLCGLQSMIPLSETRTTPTSRYIAPSSPTPVGANAQENEQENKNTNSYGYHLWTKLEREGEACNLQHAFPPNNFNIIYQFILSDRLSMLSLV